MGSPIVITQSKWKVETCHMAATPSDINAAGLADLRKQVQKIADEKRTRVDRPPIGQLEFRYEHDDRDRVSVVHAYFIGSMNSRKGKRTRFMRLRRVS